MTTQSNTTQVERSPLPEHVAAARQECERRCPWWAEATAVEQQWVAEDLAAGCMHFQDGTVTTAWAEEYWTDPMSRTDHMDVVKEQRVQYGWSIVPVADAVQADKPQEQAAPPTPPPAPTHTMIDVNKTRARFVSLLQQRDYATYDLGECAAVYVAQFLGASPGMARRSTAVDSLAKEWRDWDEESLSQPEQQSMRRLREWVNTLLAVNAVRCYYGDGHDAAKGDGTKSGRGKGSKGKPIAWSKLRELRPLVVRKDDDYAEDWSPLSAAVAGKGKDLVGKIASDGIARADVVAAVKALLVEHTAARLEHARTIAAQQPDNREAQKAVVVQEKALEALAPTPKEEEEEKDTKPPTKPQEPAKTPDAPRAPEFGSMVKAASPKDGAVLLRGVIDASSDPEELVAQLVREMSGSMQVSAHARATLKAAYEALVTPPAAKKVA